MIETLILPLALFALFKLMNGSKRFEFDWGTDRGSFWYSHQQYQRLFYLIFIISLPSSIWLADLKLTTQAWWLFGAAIDALLFNALVAFYYETYLHTKYPKWNREMAQHVADGAEYVGPSNYTALRYSVILSLGFSSIVLFVMGAGAAFLRFTGN